MNIQLHHIGLAVDDVDATLDALHAALGAERVSVPSAGHVLVRVGDLHLALVPRRDTDPPVRAWGDHLALTVPRASVEDIVGRLVARGWHSREVDGRLYARNGDASLTLELLVV